MTDSTGSSSGTAKRPAQKQSAAAATNGTGNATATRPAPSPDVSEWLDDLGRAETPVVAPGQITAFGSLLYYRGLTAGLIVAGVVLGALASFLLVGQPQATGSLAVSDPRGNDVLRQGVTTEASFETFAEQRAVFARSDAVLEHASELLSSRGMPRTPKQLRAAVATATTNPGALITVTASGATGDQAVTIVNAVIDSYRELTRKALEAQADSELAAIDSAKRSILSELAKDRANSVASLAAAQTVSQLEVRASNARLDVSAASDGTRFVDAARAIPTSRASKTIRGALIGGAVGLLLAVIAAFALADRVPTGAEGKPVRRR